MTASPQQIHDAAEEWRPVPDYEGQYEVSNLGRVRSLPRFRARGGLRKIHVRGHYLAVPLWRGKTCENFYVHRLVAAAFCEHPAGKDEVRHLDGNSLNNRADNLAWGTHSENELDKIQHGTHNTHGKTHCPQDHPYDEANTYRTPDGRRECKACRRQRDARRATARASRTAS